MLSIIYWCLFIVFIFIICILSHNFNRYDNGANKYWKWFTFFILSIYVFLGPMKMILEATTEKTTTPPTIKTNIELPDGCYFLGCELVSSYSFTADEMEYYHYEFGVVDYEFRNDVYSYETTVVLNPNVPYLLLMDSMGTTTQYTDDEIISVYSCIE